MYYNQRCNREGRDLRPKREILRPKRETIDSKIVIFQNKKSAHFLTNTKILVKILCTQLLKPKIKHRQLEKARKSFASGALRQDFCYYVRNLKI